MIHFNCPNCNEPVNAEDELLGAQALCPQCRKVLTVRKPESAGTPGGRSNRAGLPAAQPLDKSASEAPAQSALPDEFARTATVADQRLARKEAKGAASAKTDGALVDGPKGVVLGSGRHRAKRSRLWIMLGSLFRRGNPTDAGLVLTGILGAALTWLLYFAVVWRLPADNELNKVLAQRGWVQYATVFFTVWAAVVLAVKYWKIATQQASLTYELFPADRAIRITPANVDLIEQHIKKLPVNPRQSFLLKRVLMALENFKARKNVSEVAAVLRSQSDTDGAIVDSSYAMLKVLIWCIPILGFIGTVIGISQAVSNFDSGIRAKDANIEVIKAALGEVTTGLAVAFDTTFLGLILSMVIMFPTNSVQKTEEDLLSTIDQYCTENLLSRLDGDNGAHSGQPPDLQAAMDVMQAYQARLIEWQGRLENLEAALLEQVVDTLGEVREELAERKAAAPVPTPSLTPPLVGGRME
jgi:biopolymer transport protein ExbB/TolQ